MLEVEPETRAAIRRLIRRAPALETPTCPVRDLADAAVWPDCIKSLGDRFSYASSWHYQNVHVCEPFDQQAACRDGDCVSAQVERNARLLADETLPVRERLTALAFLAHLVGDLHMPLHAGDRGDLGGNRFPVAYGVIAGRTSLHLAWDGYLAERAISTPPGDARGLLAGLGEAERAEIAGGTVQEWARQSWEIGREHAYGGLLADPCGPVPEERPVIREELTRELIPVVRAQVARAGLRLARLLDEALA